VAACYAIGYAGATIYRDAWLKPIEIANVVTACVILAVLIALLTPIADPARLAVADQVARLNSGRISLDQFDFDFLRFRSGRYGEQALERLKTKQDGPDAGRIAQKANEVLDQRFPNVVRATPHTRAANITVLGSGAVLPDSFLQQDWSEASRRFVLPSCLTANAKCEAVWSDLDGDGTSEILLFALPAGIATAFKARADGRWAVLGPLANASCPGVREALRAGKFETVAPSLREIEVGQQRLHVNAGCTPTAP
jgi:hypothetical protein